MCECLPFCNATSYRLCGMHVCELATCSSNRDTTIGELGSVPIKEGISSEIMAAAVAVAPYRPSVVHVTKVPLLVDRQVTLDPEYHFCILKSVDRVCQRHTKST